MAANALATPLPVVEESSSLLITVIIFFAASWPVLVASAISRSYMVSASRRKAQQGEEGERGSCDKCILVVGQPLAAQRSRHGRGVDAVEGMVSRTSDPGAAAPTVEKWTGTGGHACHGERRCKTRVR